MQRGPRPCRFGANCRNLAQGNCTYYHPPGQVPNSQPTGPFTHHSNRGPRGPNSNPNPNYNPPGSYNQPNYNDYNQPRPNNNPQSHNTYGGPRSNPNNGPREYNNGPREYNKGPRNNDDNVANAVCRNFQLGIECKFGEKCNRKHAFIVTGNQNQIKRFMMMRNVPVHPISKLTKFRNGDKDYFGMRNNADVSFFEFNWDTKNLVDMYSWKLPNPEVKYTFYDHKNQFIYYGRDNPQGMYQDIGFFNLEAQKNYIAPSAHQGSVTGLAHFSPEILLSTSMTGELKVWAVNGDVLQVLTAQTDKLKSLFNPQNANLELYFIDISDVSGTKIIAVGSSDGRLLFFIGNNLDYKHVVLGEQYVFQVRYTTRENVPCAVILTWNHTRTHSAILEINLSDFSIRPLVEVSTTPDNPKNTINLFEFVHGRLFVATLTGFVSIHSYPECVKVGGIHHNNAISDIIESTDLIKTTNLKIKQMMILQKRTEQKEGSLGIYIMS